MNKIRAEYYQDYVEIRINNKSKIVYVEDLSEISELLKFMSKELNLEVEEINN